MLDFVYKNKALPMKNGFQIKLFKFSLEIG